MDRVQTAAGGADDGALDPARARAYPHPKAGMVKRYHESFPSFSYEFDSRYPLHADPPRP
jgi:hypothetical protein